MTMSSAMVVAVPWGVTARVRKRGGDEKVAKVLVLMTPRQDAFRVDGAWQSRGRALHSLSSFRADTHALPQVIPNSPPGDAPTCSRPLPRTYSCACSPMRLQRSLTFYAMP